MVIFVTSSRLLWKTIVTSPGFYGNISRDHHGVSEQLNVTHETTINHLMLMNRALLDLSNT